MTKIHGGQIVAKALKREGVDTLFTLTGGHILPILDGCVQEGIRVIDVRHEQAAVHAAEAYARLTGQLGVAAVTAGPGVTDAITGVANAFYAGTPLLLLGGRHLLRQQLKGGLQEIDHPPLLRPVTRWAETAWQVERLAEYIATSTHHAWAGRGGPVFLDIPMDVQFDQADEEQIKWSKPRHKNLTPGLASDELDQVIRLLREAKRPVILAGRGPDGLEELPLTNLAEEINAPTYLNGRARGALPSGHRLRLQHTRGLALSEADLVLALGVDWDFRMKYGEGIPEGTTIIQVDADPTKIGWNRSVSLGLVADPVRVVQQLAELAESGKLPYRKVGADDWTDHILTEEANRQAEFDNQASDRSVPINPHRFGSEVARFFGTESIVAVDGGDIVSTTARWLQTSRPGFLLDPGPFGTLGTGAPFALAAKLAYPDRQVGIVYGDGAFGFNGMEYDTLIRHQLPVVGVMGNDGVWANIKTLHRMFFPDRLVATDLGIRPYHRQVESMGGYGELVEDPEEIFPALQRAQASGLPALVNVHIAETQRMSSNYGQ